MIVGWPFGIRSPTTRETVTKLFYRRKLRTTNVIERCFVEVRRQTRPMVCFVNVESVEHII